MSDEWQLVRDAPGAAGVAGVEDLGRFVNNTQYFAPSGLDQRAAAPVLLDLLPKLRDPRVVKTVGQHLQRPWLRKIDGAYDTLRDAYVRWGRFRDETGWVLGDALCKAATRTKADDLVTLAADAEFGGARGCIVEALWHFNARANIEPLLRQLVRDPTVTYMAMSSLQRTIGAEAMVPVLEQLLETAADPIVRAAADRQLRRVRRTLARRSTNCRSV